MSRPMSNYKVFVFVFIGFIAGLILRKNILSLQNLPKCKRYTETLDMTSNSKLLKVTDEPITVKAKSNKFHNNYRPYFVYSELGFKDLSIIGVKITEAQLIDFGVSINTTWSVGSANLIFFTPYSRNLKFHDKYVKRLNLNIVQLPDIMENSRDTDFSLRVLQYMKDHFGNKFNWFVLVNMDVYVNIQNLQNFLKLLNSTQEIVIAGQRDSNVCDAKDGLILSHNALSKNLPDQTNSNTLPAKSFMSILESNFEVFCVSSQFL